MMKPANIKMLDDDYFLLDNFLSLFILLSIKLCLFLSSSSFLCHFISPSLSLSLSVSSSQSASDSEGDQWAGLPSGCVSADLVLTTRSTPLVVKCTALPIPD